MKKNPKLDALFANPPTGISLEKRYGPKLFASFESDIREIIRRAGAGPMPAYRAIRTYLNDTYNVSLSYGTVYEHVNRLKREVAR